MRLEYLARVGGRWPSHALPLIEPVTSRKLWDGFGNVDTGGIFSADYSSGAASAVAAIFDELQEKGIVRPQG